MKRLTRAQVLDAARTMDTTGWADDEPHTIVTHVKTSMDADWRTRKGQREYRMSCDRCGLVRWFPLSAVGAPHCVRGWFLLLLKRGRAR